MILFFFLLASDIYIPDIQQNWFRALTFNFFRRRIRQKTCQKIPIRICFWRIGSLFEVKVTLIFIFIFYYLFKKKIFRIVRKIIIGEVLLGIFFWENYWFYFIVIVLIQSIDWFHWRFHLFDLIDLIDLILLWLIWLIWFWVNRFHLFYCDWFDRFYFIVIDLIWNQNLFWKNSLFQCKKKNI